MTASWNTWCADRPAELQHLASGFSITPVLYSARANRFSVMPSQPGFEFGKRSFDNGSIAFKTSLEDTGLDWQYDLSTMNQAIVEWRSTCHGEWGLRFWVTLCVRGPEGCKFVYDRSEGVLRGQLADGKHCLEIRSAKDPLLVTFHDNLEALGDEFEKHGYFYLASRGLKGHCAAMRFNLEEAPAMRIAAALHPVERPVLPVACDEIKTEQKSAQASLAAIHDVISWNHVYDHINNRPYTCLTRNWNTQKFGGFGVWLNDILYNALLWSYFDHDKAKQNIEAVFAWQTEDGNFPCLVTGNDAWLDRSQPPIASYVVWVLYQRSGDREFLAWAYPGLLRNYDWWWRRRKLKDTGLVAYGTSLDVGDGLYKGTKLAAKDESSMDNMPVHDPAPFNQKTGLIESCDIGLNSLLAVDGEVLALMAKELAHNADAYRLESQYTKHKTRITEWLWDEQRGVFANRLLNGVFVEPLAPTSFFALAIGDVARDRTQKMINGFLKPHEKFGGDYGLPSVTRDHPAYHDNVYWRGRVWAPLNYWVYQSLCRAGKKAEASELADMSYRLFDSGWQNRKCGENYNAETGEINDQADTDAFYSWGALLPAIMISEVTDVTPWHGMTLDASHVDDYFGPVLTPIGSLVIRSQRQSWLIELNGKPWLSSNIVGGLSHISRTDSMFVARLPAFAGTAWFEFSGETISFAEVNGTRVRASGGRIEIESVANNNVLKVAFG